MTPSAELAEEIAVVCDLRDGCRELVAVRPRHTFGPPGGARGVEHEAGTVLINDCRLARRVALRETHIRSLAHLAASRPNNDARHTLATALRQRLADGVGRDLFEGDRLCIRIVEAESHLCSARAPVEGREYHPERLAGPVENSRLIAVLKEDQQSVALREAEPHQTTGQA